jgi:DNA-binding MurR/RpiR family transcriptional regulator
MDRLNKTMRGKLLAKLQDRFETLTSSQKKVGEFIFQNPEETSFMSINQLSEKTKVSKATIVRFCNAIGYKGYLDFSRILQQDIQQNLSNAGSFNLSQRYIGDNASHDELPLLKRIYDQEMHNAAWHLDYIKKGDFLHAQTLLLEAGQIVIVGCLSSASLAIHLGNALSKILPKVRVLTCHSIESENVMDNLDEKSVLVSIAFPRYPKATVELTELAKENNSKIIAISNSSVSPIMPLSDVSFVCPSTIHSFVDSYAVPLMFLTALTVSLSIENKRIAEANLKKFDRYAKKYNLFY